MANAPTTVRQTQALLDPRYREVRHVGPATRQPGVPKRDRLAAYHGVGRHLLELAARTGRKEAAQGRAADSIS